MRDTPAAAGGSDLKPDRCAAPTDAENAAFPALAAGPLQPDSETRGTRTNCRTPRSLSPMFVECLSRRETRLRHQRINPMNPKRFDELKSTGLLPSPTGVGLEILRLARKESTSIEEIAKVIQADPALTGRVLKYANTGNAASGMPIATVRDAVVRIGVRATTGIVMGFTVICNCRNGGCPGFDYARFWSHSLAVALGGQALARRARGVSPDEGFLAGLLGQIGRLALASVHPDKYAEVLAESTGRSSAELLRLEHRHFATNHNELTGAMLDDWGLPKYFSTAVQHHEHPEDGGLVDHTKEKQLARVLHAGILLAEICVAENDRRAAVLAPEFLRRAELLGVPAEEVVRLVEETIGLWQDWGRMLNISTWPVPSFQELLAKSVELEAQPEGNPQEIADDGIPPQPPRASAAPPVCKVRTGLRVLVADDDAVTLRILTELLSASGHEVHSTRNGDEALRVALEVCPQLVITDWSMPQTTGPELCRSLRATEFGRQMYIIMLTAQSDEEHLVDALEAGADDFVVKPFRAKPLFARIRAALRVINLQEELARNQDRMEKISANLAIANRRLEMDALTDELTGLPNRRYLMERLSHDWAVARRSGQPLACMVLDIDHFKQINDTHGHDIGDQVLARVAMILNESIRSTDVVCRYGGEEFIVVGADSDLDSALRCAERLRRAVEVETAASIPKLLHAVTISVGVAVRSEHTRTPEALLKEADEAMYRAKQSGRNRVCGARTKSAADAVATRDETAAEPTTSAAKDGQA